MLRANERVALMIETGAIFSMAAVSGLAYLAGDVSAKVSQGAYRIGAQLDSISLDIFQVSLDTMNKYIWKEIDAQDGKL